MDRIEKFAQAGKAQNKLKKSFLGFGDSLVLLHGKASNQSFRL